MQELDVYGLNDGIVVLDHAELFSAVLNNKLTFKSGRLVKQLASKETTGLFEYRFTAASAIEYIMVT